MTNNHRVKELADFLKKRRMTLNPAEFGISKNKRRRTPGLRREEVADLAGISVTWYTWLEQGRKIQVSTAVLENLSQALRMDPIEREHLFVLAGKTNAANESHPEIVSESLQNIVASLETYPACILGRRWDILVWNEAACALLGNFDLIPAEERNTIWRVFTNPDLRQRIVNWEEIAQQVLAQFRISYDRNAGDSLFEELVERLKARSSEFRLLWSNHDVLGRDDGYREVNHPLAGKMAFQHGTFQVHDSPDLKLLLYTPLQKYNTKEKLQKILCEFRSCKKQEI